MRRTLTAVVLTWAAVGPSWAAGPGPASVISSDTLMLNGIVFQFDGLDGVEFHQFCFVDGQAWACGVSATRALQTLLDGIMVTCTPIGEKNGDRVLAVCRGDDQDIGEFMVRQGWAMANRAKSGAYVAAELAARENEDGIWRSMFVEPWVFREDIAAIEKKYLEEASASILAEAEQALATNTGFGVFAHIDINSLNPTEDVMTSDHEVRVAGLAAGFVFDAIPPHEAFSWPVVARALENWRQSSIRWVVSGARDPVWEGLIDRPSDFETVDSETAYYRAIGKYAPPLLEQGRQPVLLVASPMLPTWVGNWFHGSPPDDAEITKKTDIFVQGYMGTIDGIDVYVGPTPGTDSLLFPDDILVAADYRKDADGAILKRDRSTANTQDEMVYRYSIALEWKPDIVVRLHYPYEDNE